MQSSIDALIILFITLIHDFFFVFYVYKNDNKQPHIEKNNTILNNKYFKMSMRCVVSANLNKSYESLKK